MEDAFEFFTRFAKTSKNIVYSRFGVDKSVKISDVRVSDLTEIFHYSLKNEQHKLLAQVKGGFFLEIVKKSMKIGCLTYVSNWVFLCVDFSIFQYLTMNEPFTLAIRCFEQIHRRGIPRDELPLSLQRQYQSFIKVREKYGKPRIQTLQEGDYEVDRDLGMKICDSWYDKFFYSDSDDED